MVERAFVCQFFFVVVVSLVHERRFASELWVEHCAKSVKRGSRVIGLAPFQLSTLLSRRLQQGVFLDQESDQTTTFSAYTLSLRSPSAMNPRRR